MANVEKLSVALTPDMVAEVRAAVEAGDYGSVSEVVRDALRDWRLRRKIEALEADELRRLACAWQCTVGTSYCIARTPCASNVSCTVPGTCHG